MSVGSITGSGQQEEIHRKRSSVAVSWPWWIHPAWALLLLTGSTGLLAIALPDDIYETWAVRKFLNGDLMLLLMIGIVAAFVGIMLASGAVSRSGMVIINFCEKQRQFLRRAFWVMFVLALVSYAIWIGSAVAQGVSIADLTSVVNRDPGAISSLKGNSRPIGGLTTMTQLAPVVVILGQLLRKMGERVGWASLILVVLAGVRTIFYAERLALIEVLIPLLLVSALTIGPNSKWRSVSRLAPLIVAPLVWVVFAVSEYTRSWIFYQQTTTLPFVEWVSARLAGYYVTSFNNSALLSLAHSGSNATPYFTFPAIWNAPGAPAHQGVYGLPPDAWWTSVLMTEGNPEFTNPGSILVSYAELGAPGMIVFWISVGLIVGGLFVAMSKGSVAGLVATCGLFVGILELPRFIYWTQGRATPLLLALIIIAVCYPKQENKKPSNPMLPAWVKSDTDFSPRGIAETRRTPGPTP